MRQLDIVTSAPGSIAIPADSFSIITVNGPSFQLTAQTQILRFLFVHAQWQVEANNPAIFDVTIGDAALLVTINPNKGANKVIVVPARTVFASFPAGGATGLNTGADLTAATGLFAGASDTFDFYCEELNIRGDDFPTQGGIQLVPPGAAGGGVFSIKTQFRYPMAAFNGGGGGGGSQGLVHHFDMLTDLTDYGPTPFKT